MQSSRGIVTNVGDSHLRCPAADLVRRCVAHLSYREPVMYIVYSRRQLVRDAVYMLTIGVAFGVMFFWGLQ